LSRKPRVAIVHDWLTGMRGGEYMLEAIAELFPRAELFTLLYVPGKISPVLTTLKRHVSPLQRVPAAEKRYRSFLPVMPWLIERFDLSAFDLVISSSHCVAKGVRKRPDAVHVSYVYAPMRYVWDRFDDYFGPGRSSAPVRLAARALRARLRAWDRGVSGPDRVDMIIGISRFIAGEIRGAYGRADARVLYPFADLERFSAPRARPAGEARNHLMVGAFAPYKRVDLAIEAFNRLKLPLVIVGSGQDQERLRRLAGPTVEFLGALSNPAVADIYSKSRSLIFPGKEDFGITPLEAMASGLPVIAFGEGGAAETVKAPEAGWFFREQTVESLMDAVRSYDDHYRSYSEAAARARAAEFTRKGFQDGFRELVREAWRNAGKDPAPLEELLQGGWAR
jgi:glycosyltransferase involved in cell wall biosynthesis